MGRTPVKITADTNVLLRAAAQDDSRQARIAAHELRTADSIAIPIAGLCEFVWVMRQGYKRPASEVAQAIHSLLDSAHVVTNRPAAEAGLRVLEAGGDFADGAIAFEGEWLGAEEFVSFDRKAISILNSSGKRARLLM
jgi:predicted nucleic-acid-binding protein